MDLSKLSDEELAALYQTARNAQPDNLSADEAQRRNIGPDRRGVIDKLIGNNGPRYQTLPERVVRDFAERTYAGIKNAGDYVYGSMEQAKNPPTTISDSDVSGPSATIVDAAQIGVGPSLRLGREMRVADDLRSAATRHYESPSVKDLRINPAGPARLAEQTIAAIEQKGARPFQKGMSEIYRTMDELRGLPNGQSVPRGVLEPQTVIAGPGYHIAEDVFSPAPATVQDIAGARTALRNTVQAGTDPLTGAMNPAAGRAAQASGKITDYLGNLPAEDVVSGDPAAAAASLRAGGQDYAAAKKLEIIDALRRRAELSRGAANSGSNLNTERQAVKNFILNQRKASGLTPAEEAAAERAVTGTTVGNKARSLAHALDPRGALSFPAVASQGGIGGYLGAAMGFDPVTSAIVSAFGSKALGKVARGVANSSEERALNNFRQIVLEGSPSARASIANDKRQAMNAALARALLSGVVTNGVGF